MVGALDLALTALDAVRAALSPLLHVSPVEKSLRGPEIVEPMEVKYPVDEHALVAWHTVFALPAEPGLCSLLDLLHPLKLGSR